MGRNRQAHATPPDAGTRASGRYRQCGVKKSRHRVTHTTPSLLAIPASARGGTCSRDSNLSSSRRSSFSLAVSSISTPSRDSVCCTLNRLRDVCDLRRDVIHRPATEQAMQTDTSGCSIQNLSCLVLDSPRTRSKQFLMAPRCYPRRVRFPPAVD